MTESRFSKTDRIAWKSRSVVFGTALMGIILGTITALDVAAQENTAAAEAPDEFSVLDQPRPIPEFSFSDGDGNSLTLAEFEGRIVLLNIWATWCAPCREEMPILDQLQANLGGDDFVVLPLSLDTSGTKAVTDFYKAAGIKRLGVYVDSAGTAMHALGILGLPVTLLIDREGKEIGRRMGPAAWGSPKFVAYFRSLIRSDITTP